MKMKRLEEKESEFCLSIISSCELAVNCIEEILLQDAPESDEIISIDDFNFRIEFEVANKRFEFNYSSDNIEIPLLISNI